MDVKQREEMRKKIWGPYTSAAIRLFSSEDGKKVLEALERQFAENVISHDPSGRVDDKATLINVGRADVVTFLRELSRTPKEDRT